MPSPIPSFRYNERAGRFITSQGRFVSERTIRATLDTILDASSAEMVALSKQLQAGTIGLDAWFLGMQQEIKNVHMIGYSMAKGGWGQLSQSDYGKIGNILKGEYRYLRNLAEQISNGTQRLDGRLLARVQLYVYKARSTYTNVERLEKEKRGFTEEARILGKAEHCSDCVRFADEGYQPIGTLPPIGDSLCRSRCRCVFIYR